MGGWMVGELGRRWRIGGDRRGGERCYGVVDGMR